jgi:ferrous iron transport protein B
MMGTGIVCLVGNPNCGKTTLFNGLTGARQRVGNWPGVTVERKSGVLAVGGTELTIVDLPGVYSLAVTAASPLDERIARDFVLSGEADLVINIVDASNLERNLYLTAQLIEMRVPLIVVLNMMDIARERRIRIDVDRLAARLGCPVLPIVANRSQGIDELKGAILEAAAKPRAVQTELAYDPEIEGAVAELVPALADIAGTRRVSARWLAIKLLEGDEGARQIAGSAAHPLVSELSERILDASGDDPDILIADGRYGFANSLIRDAVQRSGVMRRTFSDRIDQVVLHRILGVPIFLAVMYLLFLFTINFGSAFIDLFDGVVGTLLVDGLGHLLSGLGSPDWLTVFLATGVGGGIQTVATFIPVIACLYLFLSVLEDSGYMARAAFVMDRVMRAVGLPGKSFIPLIVGFGCNVPAIMATRTLENRRDRILTVMMAPFMSCGARLPVYALFAAAFFPVSGQNVVFALYLIGIGFAVLTGLVLKSTVLRGETSPFIMELPPYHMPTLKAVLLRTWDRLKAFTIRAGRVIVVVVVVLNVLGSIGTDGSFGHDGTDSSVLAQLGKGITPVFEPMGIDEENWPATVGILTGIFAKEAVIGTLDTLYGALAATDGGTVEEAEDFDLWSGLTAAVMTVPENLAGLVDALTDPLGLGVVGEEEATAEVSEGTFGAMVARFDSAVGAFAYLLAVLLYMPCVAATAAIYRETGAAWAVFASLWTSGLAYGAAVIAFQAGTFARDPATATLWISGILVLFAAALGACRYVGVVRLRAASPLPAE